MRRAARVSRDAPARLPRRLVAGEVPLAAIAFRFPAMMNAAECLQIIKRYLAASKPKSRGQPCRMLIKCPRTYYM